MFAKLTSTLFGISEAWAQRRAEFDHPGALCDLNTPLGNSAYCMTDQGSMLTVLELAGSREYVMLDGHRDRVETLVGDLEPFIMSGTTDFAWLHNHLDEPEANRRALEKALASVRSVSRMQGYENEVFINETIDVMTPRIQNESSYLCIWTLSKEGARAKSDIPILKAPGHQDTQKLITAERLLASHQAKISRIEETIKEMGMHVRRLLNSEVGEMLAIGIDPEANATFTPKLLGDIKKGKHENEPGSQRTIFHVSTPENLNKGLKGKDYSIIFPPKVGFQLWRQQPEYAPRSVTVGRRSYASIMITMGPDKEVALEKLISTLKRDRVPFRFAMYNRGNSARVISVKFGMASMLKKLPGHSNNNLLAKATSQIKAFNRANNAVISMQMMLTVWAPKDDKTLLDNRIEQAIKAIGAWGNAHGQLMRDDSLLGLVASMPPYRSRCPAPAAVGPAEEVLGRAPLTRPALPWKEGGMLVRSVTGKLMPIQPLSDVLSHQVILVCGEPGFGKSLWCAIFMIAIAETHDVLPYIAMTDVGVSSLGTIRYLQSILPVQKKHMVTYCAMRNSEEMSINRFDTPLGVRIPIADDLDGMIQWLTLGLADSQTGKLQNGIDTLISDIITLSFDRAADEGPKAEPKRHDEANEFDPLWRQHIAPVLERHNLTLTRDSVYWRLVDKLFDLGETHAAGLVQRFAVPLLEDMISACNAREIRDAHAQELSPGYTLADYAHQRLVSLRNELLVTHRVTQFDLSDVRVSSFDLEAVVQNSNTFSAKRRGGLFFGLTSGLQVEPFFWDKTRVQDMPVKYREYHQLRLDEVSRTKNLYFADEQHYFTGIDIANRIPDNIAALGRKRGIGVMLATQLPRHFTPLMRELSKMRVYVGFERSSIQSVVDDMKLNDDEAWLLSRHIRKPNRDGSHFLIQLEAEDGYYSQVCNLVVGIRKLWGLSTKSTSTTIREEVIKAFGYQNGIEVLARLFPKGEAESEYERLRVQMAQGFGNDTGLEQRTAGVQTNSILQGMIDETIERGRSILAELTN
ncbi:hypothetical protein [Marinimicrobium sp. ABcell2]|uniref:hypothetical protein n=1 Tax=Marinimicrobium sp. ABcell2 TaxID=3069751 RepID=UPI0027AF07D3|nr:hypothetical protein [Marinimicrobium sp. ABcell2]MDQ2077392.1 hypothetical protein [Marinimicrobium sp. ABcell2]